MNKGTHFSGQPMYGQLINMLNKEEILKFSREYNGERYVKRFDAYQHMAIMLYAVIRKFDTLREITDSMFPEARKLAHLGIRTMPRRSTLSDANARRPEAVFEATYRSLLRPIQGRTFLGQPKTADARMVQPPADYRLHDNKPFFQPHFQRRRQASQDREKEGWHKSAHQYPR